MRLPVRRPPLPDDMIEAPTLNTERLRLRAHRVNDYEDCCNMWSDPAVTRFIGGRPSTTQQTWSRLLTYMGHWKAMGFGYWAIEEKATGVYAGEIGFADFKRDIAESMRNAPEIGFALRSTMHGRGYGTEAVGAVVAWGDLYLPSPRTVALVNEENQRSLRILERFGYCAFDRAQFNGSRVMYLERLGAR